MDPSDSGRYSSSSTRGTPGTGFLPSGGGGVGGIGSSQGGFGGLPGSISNTTMQAAATVQAASQAVPLVTGMIQSVSNMFDTGKKDREREQRMLAAEKQRHEEQMRKIEEENERANQSRNQIYAARQENYNKANIDLQRKQIEREKREQELTKRKDQERKVTEEAARRERELCDQRISAAEGRNQQLMSDTKASMEADHENFLVTKQHMENTHQMEVNMIKGLAGATAYLYKEMGYFNGPPEANQNVRLQELEASPSCQQLDGTQAGEGKDVLRPKETSSSSQVPECFKCGSLTKMTLCSHFFCPNCHVNGREVHCPVCQKIF